MRFYLVLLVVLLAACRAPSNEGSGILMFTSEEPMASNQSSRHYVTFLNAAESGAVENGRVPAWVPASATGINETHSVDTVQSLLGFEFDPDELSAMTQSCQPIAPEAVQFPSLAADWWEPILRDGATFDADKYTLYECPNEMGYLAVTAEGKAFFWIP